MPQNRGEMSESFAEPLVCPKCGGAEFDTVAGCTASQISNFYVDDVGQMTIEKYEWTVVEVLEDRPFFCIECGHEPGEDKLVRISTFTK